MQFENLYNAWQLNSYDAWSNAFKQSKIIAIWKIDKGNLKNFRKSPILKKINAKKSLYRQIENRNK